MLLYWKNRDNVNLITNALRSGQIIAGSSDTVLGLLADTTQEAYESINRIKVRQKPLIILIGSKEKASRFVDQADLSHISSLLEQCWPGPLTLIFKAKEGLPDYLKGPGNTVALRVPSHEGLLAALSEFEGLFSTSANITGQPVPHSIEELDESIVNQVAYLIVDDTGISKEKSPSTILDCTGATVKMVREGAFLKDTLEQILGRSIE